MQGRYGNRIGAACRACGSAGQRKDCTCVLAEAVPGGGEASGFCGGTIGLACGGGATDTLRQRADDVAVPVDAPNGGMIISYQVPQVATQTTLSSPTDPSVAGAQVTNTATVTSTSGTGAPRRAAGRGRQLE
jgi:hypothetical protein